MLHRGLNTVVSVHKVHDGLTDHAQLHQSRVGVAVAVCFRKLAKIRKHGEVCIQEVKIGAHVRHPFVGIYQSHDTVIIT